MNIVRTWWRRMTSPPPARRPSPMRRDPSRPYVPPINAAVRVRELREFQERLRVVTARPEPSR